MKRFLAVSAILCTIFLSGCTDIRHRKYADVLAIRTADSDTVSAMLRCDNDKDWISASPDTALLFQPALETAGGIQFSTGHLSLLILQGDSLSPVQQLLRDGWVAPNCPLLLCDPSEDIRSVGDEKLSDQQKAAVENGLLPEIGVGELVGNLESRTGMALLHYHSNNHFSLALHNGTTLLAVLSNDACRGAALLTDRWGNFGFSEISGGLTETILLDSCRIRFRIQQDSEDRLIIRTIVKLSLRTGDPALAAKGATRMLQAFFRETATDFGADVCYLEEAARRCGITVPSAQQWREMLRNAAFEILIE